MRKSRSAGRRFGRLSPRSSLLGGLFLLVVSPPPVHGQAAIDPSVNLGVQPTGRLFDVNPQVSGAGQNYYRPQSPLLVGNLSASGLAGRGLSLRSYSPILDPTAFRAPLGSAALYDFRRDSVGVSSSPLGSGSLVRPYYDPSTTVPTSGFLQGLSGFAPAQSSVGAKPIDMRLGSRLDLAAGPLPPDQPAFLSPAAPPGRQPQPWVESAGRATQSSIFGPGAPPRLPLPDERANWMRETPETAALRGSTTSGQPLDERIGGPLGAAAPPLSGVLRDDLYPHSGLTPPAGTTVTAVKPGLVLPQREPLQPRGPAARVVDASVLPGYDVFTDMQLALALLSEPNAPWYGEMGRALKEQPDLAKQLDKQVLENSQAFVQKMLHTPMQSLTGAGPSELNDQMLKAESLMDIKHYAEAADRYDAAHQTAPVNPLPLVGKGHALLAAGNYRSAALALLEGLTLADRTPGLATALFQRLDLTTLMGGGEVVDIRRADIMRQLAQRETPELRFLLGYLEYHSGDRERGLENLQHAAEDPRAGELIARYPRILTGELPKAPSAEPSYLPPEETTPATPAPARSSLRPTSQAAEKPVHEDLVLPPRE